MEEYKGWIRDVAGDLRLMLAVGSTEPIEVASVRKDNIGGHEVWIGSGTRADQLTRTLSEKSGVKKAEDHIRERLRKLD